MKRIPRSHPLHNFCAIVALTIAVAAQTCLAFDPNEWRNTQALEVPAKGLVRVSVQAATLDAAQPGLEALPIVVSLAERRNQTARFIPSGRVAILAHHH